jgi:long-chain acyl-CoA synthetase
MGTVAKGVPVNLADILVRSAKAFPDRPAIRLDDTVLTYAELDERSARVAGLLSRRGVGAGDRVALMLPNIPDFAAVYYGVLRVGAILVPMNPLLKEREAAFYLNDSGSLMVFAWHGCAGQATAAAARHGTECIIVDTDVDRLLDAPPVRSVAERRPDDTAVILYTSGTTGQPKGAELTHANLATYVAVTATDLLQIGPFDVLFGGLPLFHSFGQTCGLNAAISVGACLTLLPRFEPGKVLDVLARDRVTVFEGVSAMYVALLGTHRSETVFQDLRLCVSGGAALPMEVLHGFEKAFDRAWRRYVAISLVRLPLLVKAVEDCWAPAGE